MKSSAVRVAKYRVAKYRVAKYRVAKYSSRWPRALGAAALVASLGCAPSAETAGPGAGSPAHETAPESAGEMAALDSSQRPVPVRAIELRPESVAVDAEWPGELRSTRRAALAVEVAGAVRARLVEPGQRVDAGQALIEIDTRALEQRLTEAEAVDRQRAVQLERAKALHERRSITNAQLLDAITGRDVAAARLAAARLELEKSTLLAPWPGRIAAVALEVGDFATPGVVAIELIDERLEMWASAPAHEAPFLRLGQAAEVRLDAFPGELFDARLAELGAELDASSRTLDVAASLEASAALRPGFTGRLEVELRRIDGALLVPLDAVVELGGERAVYVVTEKDGPVQDGPVQDGPVAEQRKVELGPVIGADRVVVTAGLHAGDRVIVEGQRAISPGQSVRLEGL